MISLLRDMRAEFNRLFFTGDPGTLIGAIALFTVATGINLLRPYETLEAAPYLYMRNLGSENFWGWAMVAAGLGKIVLLLLSKRIFSSSCLAVRLSSPLLNAILSGFWMFLLAGIVESDPNTSMTLYYAAPTFGALWCTLRRSHQALNVPEGTFKRYRRRRNRVY